MNIIKTIFKDKELRKRLLYTLFMLLVFRLGAAITLPYINTGSLGSVFDSASIFSVMNMLGGGTLEKFSLFALGISPYITASIVIELLSMGVVPSFARWKKEGNNGKKKQQTATAILSVIIAVIQGAAMVYGMDTGYGIVSNGTPLRYAYITLLMTAGSLATMWIGQRITEKGIGNGTSLIIVTGIVGAFPGGFMSAYSSMNARSFIFFVLAYLLIMLMVVFVEMSVRKIDIFYASGIHSSKADDEVNLPFKINSASVIPVIFAISLMTAPRTIMTFMKKTAFIKKLSSILDYTQPVGFAIYIIMIILFTFFYAGLQMNVKEIAKNLSQTGGVVPGVRAGKDTKKYLGKVLNRITVAGAILLALVAVIPIVIPHIWSVAAGTSLQLGGTGLIIVANVAMEFIRQIETYSVKERYSLYDETGGMHNG